METLQERKYSALKRAINEARGGFYRDMLSELKEAEELSSRIGVPLAESVKERIKDIYKEEGIYSFAILSAINAENYGIKGNYIEMTEKLEEMKKHLNMVSLEKVGKNIEEIIKMRYEWLHKPHKRDSEEILLSGLDLSRENYRITG